MEMNEQVMETIEDTVNEVAERNVGAMKGIGYLGLAFIAGAVAHRYVLIPVIAKVKEMRAAKKSAKDNVTKFPTDDNSEETE